jgi:UDP-N-acetylmuramoyl-tripeptide--D-alanyl-D-alanine ligase
MSVFDINNFAAIVNGRWQFPPPSRDGELTGVGIDTRGDLTGRAFLAVRGERFDGHDFLHDAVRAGARLLVIDREPPQSPPPEVGVLLVSDVRRVLARLAYAHRQNLNATVIAVTGSVGKTTTKRLINAALAATMNGSCAPKSLNNEIGVPLTLLAAKPDDRYVVVEVGMNRPGEIMSLASIAEPDIAVITSVGRAHLERLGSIESIAEEKASLLKSLRGGGLAIVNADSRPLRGCVTGYKPMVLFGKAPDSHLLLTGRGCDEHGWWFAVNGRDVFRTGLPGRHNALNALAAVAVARHFGISDARISNALASVRAEAMRMTIHPIGGIDVFNDAYNANPESVAAALETFIELTAHATRRIVILGDMLELGRSAPELHAEIGRRLLTLADRARIDFAVLVGELSQSIAYALGEEWPESRITALPALDDGALASIAEMFEPGDAVLIKGSRAMAMERIVEEMEKSTARHVNTSASAKHPIAACD